MSSQTAPLVASPAAARPWALRWLKPSPAELLFLAVVLWLIAFTASGLDGVGLLRDLTFPKQMRWDASWRAPPRPGSVRSNQR